MKNCASISGVEVRSDCDFIVYGPVMVLTAECVDLREAKRILDQKRHEAMERNVMADLAIFRWSDGHWIPAISLYDLQESDLAKNPSAIIHFP